MTNEETLGTVEWLVAELARGHLVERARLLSLADQFRSLTPDGDAPALAEFLIVHSALTPYQIEKVMEGESEGLGLGPYVLAEPVGAGGLGVVYRAAGRADRKPYAIKVIPAGGVWNLRLARRQVRAFADLPSHPTLVPCVDVGTSGERQYLVWPFVAGETLDAFIARRGPLAAPDAVRLALDLADGLHLAHGHALFHGLLKPSNVMVGDDGLGRLLDFGLGALLSDDDGESLAADDQFGLGLILFFALTGRLTSDDDLPEGIPPELVDIVARLLADTSAERYRDLGELVRELQPHLDATLAEVEPTRVDTMRDTPSDLPRVTSLAPPKDRPPLTPPTSAAPAELATASLLRRALGKLTFWRPPRDAVAVSVLAPPVLRPGETATLAVFAHGAARAIQAMGRTYFPGHGLAGSVALRRPVARGERLTAHLALPGLAVEPAVQKFVWAGQTLPLPCSVHVPPDFRPGEIIGVLSLARGADVIMNHEFRVLVSES